MKIIKQILPALCFSVCVLLLGPPAKAQETNDAISIAENSALTNIDSNTTKLESTNETATNDTRPPSENDTGESDPQPIVLFGQNAELKAGDTADSVVVIGGSATINGKVRHAVVVIGGDLNVAGEVGDAAVAIFGNIHTQTGAVIHQEVVAVMGSLLTEPGIKIGGNAVAVGGKLDIAEGANIKGQKVNVALPQPFSNIDWLRGWFKHCALELRPLAPQVGFVWIIAGISFLIYLFIAVVFPHPVQVCVEDLNRRPTTLFVVGILTKLLAAFIYLILAITGIGLIVAPILWVALLVCAIVGKVAILEWIGVRIGGHFGSGFKKPAAAFLLGTIIITLLYIVPVLGLLTCIIFSVWGLGCGVTAAFGSLRRETPQKPAPPAPPVADTPPAFAPPFINPNLPPAVETELTSEPSPAIENMPPSAPPFPPVSEISPTASEAILHPKANLWERLCAAILDLILIGIIVKIIHAGSFSLIIALTYFVAMWKWQGTTIGGIVLKLKVVRTDGRPLIFVVALVRGLAAAFSAVILFLGFLWIAWDKDKQGWHDKIAGTEVVRLPKSAPLV